MSAIEVRELEQDSSALAWPVMAQLRPHLDQAAFLAALAEQRREGYRLVAAFVDGTARAAAGFRVQRMLSRGRHVYVDDLITDEAHRGSGVGKVLFAWLLDEARHQHCTRFHLDSGTWRHAAHAFYFGRGMKIAAYHFDLEL
jgi:GNAT superfamily N-acetyltransferase